LKKIELHIFELLFQHDCVILPDFGGFVANYVSAKIDENANRVFPPSKRVIFNKHLLNNDGLLAHKIIASDNINYEEALTRISEFVSSIKSSLSISKRFEVDKVGVLYLDSSNNICFKPSATNFLINSFGLPIVKAIPILEKKVAVPEQAIKEAKVKPIEIIHEKDKLQPVKEEDNVIPISAATKYSKRRNYWWAAAVLIPVAFYSAWIPMKTDLLNGGENFQYSDLNPFTYSKTKVSAYHKHELVDVSLTENEALTEEGFKESLGDGVYAQYPLDGSIDITVQLKEVEDIFVAETTYVEKETYDAVEEVSLEKGYFVIGGCFGKKSNADKLVEELQDKGYDAMIVDQNEGLHRVAFGKYSSRNEAKKVKKEIKNTEGLSAWVLKK